MKISFFKYIEPLWLGRDGKISLRSILAIVLTGDLIWNFHTGMGDMALTIEAGLIAGLLALKTYTPTNNYNNYVPPTASEPGPKID